jgi:hypothetical protein
MEGNVVIIFDKCLKYMNGFVPGIKMRPVQADIGAIVVDNKEKSKNTIDVNNLHKILGHYSEVSARLTGKALGYNVLEHLLPVKRAPFAKKIRKTSIFIGKEVVAFLERNFM